MELRTSLLRNVILETLRIILSTSSTKKKKTTFLANQHHLDLFDYKTGVCPLFIRALFTIPLLFGFDLTAMWLEN